MNGYVKQLNKCKVNKRLTTTQPDKQKAQKDTWTQQTDAPPKQPNWTNGRRMKREVIANEHKPEHTQTKQTAE